MTPQEQLEKAAREYSYQGPNGLLGDQTIGDVKRNSFIAGSLKGMEIQKEIDRQEIERLREALSETIAKMTKARDILQTGPSGGNWGLLDASKYTDLLSS